MYACARTGLVDRSAFRDLEAKCLVIVLSRLEIYELFLLLRRLVCYASYYCFVRLVDYPCLHHWHVSEVARAARESDAVVARAARGVRETTNTRQ